MPSAVARHPGDFHRPRTVLVVDDEPLIQLSLGRMLRLRGFLPLGAATIAGAVRAIEGGGVAAVVLDLSLSGREPGLDFLPWLRAQPRHRTTPVLILTGQPNLGSAQLAIARRHHALVLYKPVSFATLDHCLTMLFGGSAPVRSGNALAETGFPSLAKRARVFAPRSRVTPRAHDMKPCPEQGCDGIVIFTASSGRGPGLARDSSEPVWADVPAGLPPAWRCNRPHGDIVRAPARDPLLLRRRFDHSDELDAAHLRMFGARSVDTTIAARDTGMHLQ